MGDNNRLLSTLYVATRNHIISSSLTVGLPARSIVVNEHVHPSLVYSIMHSVASLGSLYTGCMLIHVDDHSHIRVGAQN